MFIRAEVVFILARGGVYSTELVTISTELVTISTELVTISPIWLPFMRLALAFSIWCMAGVWLVYGWCMAGVWLVYIHAELVYISPK